MLIRSQNKKELINLNNVACININDKKMVAWFPEVDNRNVLNCNLGEYETEEKTMKVLDMIQSAYENLQYYRYTKDHIISMYSVFEMPQDQELK